MRKLLSTAVAIGIFTSASLVQATYAAVDATALPSFNNSPTNNVNVTTSGSNMTIQVGNGVKGAVGEANWNSFNIGSGAKVEVEFTNHHQTSLNRVSANGGLSQIYGQFTDKASCDTCGYNATSKVILLNPNGILFGSGANVNINSFTASTMDATYNRAGSLQDELSLNLSGGNLSDHGIKVESGATITGGKNITFASNNINTYAGSKITTANLQGDNNTVGNVKLYTTDGVNFYYTNRGMVKANPTMNSTNASMKIALNGTIESGDVHVKNASTTGEVNINGANITAYKANRAATEAAPKGNILIESGNDIIIDNSAKLATVTSPKGADAKMANGGDITVNANNLLSIKKSTISNGSTGNAEGNVTLTSANSNAIVAGSTVKSAKNITVTAANGTASIQTPYTNNVSDGTASTLTAVGDITVSGKNAYVEKSTLNAANINLIGDNVYTWGTSNLTASNNANITANNGIASLQDTTTNAKNINVKSTKGSVKFVNTTNTATGGDIDIQSKNSIAYNNNTGANANTSNIVNSTFTANNIALTSDEGNVYLNNTDPVAPFNTAADGKLKLKAGQNINLVKTTGNYSVRNVDIDAGNNAIIKASAGDLTVYNTTNLKNAKIVSLQAPSGSVETSGILDLNNLKTNIVAYNKIDAKLANAGNPEKGLNASTTTGDIKLNTEGTLSVAKIVAGKDVDITANAIVKGKGYDLNNAESYMPDPTAGGLTDPTSRGYIEVGHNNGNVGELKLSSNLKSVLDQDGNYIDGSRDSEGNVLAHHLNFSGSDAAGKIYLVQKVKKGDGATNPNTPANPNGNETGLAQQGSGSLGEAGGESIDGGTTPTTPTTPSQPSQPSQPSTPNCDSPANNENEDD